MSERNLMASLIKEIKVVRMSDEANNQEREGSRKVVLLEVAYGLYAAHVYTLSLRLLASVRDAEEATVQVFVRLGRELARRWDEAHILGRLRELTIDEALRRLRGRPSKRLNGGAEDAGSPPASSIGRPTTERSGRAISEKTQLDSATLDRLAAKLPVELRVAFVLRDREGLDDRAVATHLQIKEAEARRLIHRARLELRRLWLAGIKESSTG
jgi:RNA polymerase sigma-70 factor (ECF subfamily)